MCGIIGIVGNPEYSVASDIYDGLLVLQHRGQDAAGIVTFDDENLYHRRKFYFNWLMDMLETSSKRDI